MRLYELIKRLTFLWVLFTGLAMGQYVSTLAGTGQAGHQDGPGPSALFTNPHGVAMGSDGSVFVADLGNNRIRKITPDGGLYLCGERTVRFF